MSLTRKQKGYVAVLCVALTALAADRLWLMDGGGVPAPAQGGTIGRPAPPRPMEAPEAATSAEATEPLAVRLRTAIGEEEADYSSMRDVFRPAGEWAETGTDREGHRAEPDALSIFAERHTITSILANGHAGAVVLGDRVVQTGQEVDGFRLTEVLTDRAVFSSAAGEVVLRLRAGAGEGSGPVP